MVLRRTTQRMRIFGIGTKDTERHRESRFSRPLDAIKLVIFTGAFFAGSVTLMSFMRKAQVAVDPKSSLAGLHNKMADIVFDRPDLAIALTQMTIHHTLSGVRTPFAAPMVCPPHLEEAARELEAIIVDLMTHKNNYSPADLWAILATKALKSIGGPELTMKCGRPVNPLSVKVEVVPSIVQDDERDVRKLKTELTRRGYRVSDIAALVGCARSIGYHSDAKVRYDKEKRQYVDATLPTPLTTTDDDGKTSVTPTGDAVFRKTTTHPFIFAHDYFDELVQYQWKSAVEHEKVVQKELKEANGGGGLLGGLFGGGNKAKTAIAEAEKANYFRCDDRRKQPLRVKYIVRRQAAAKVLTKDEAEAEEAERIADANAEAAKGICAQISMAPIDVSLLDDVQMVGWCNRYADNEKDYYDAVHALVAGIVERGYADVSLDRTFAA